MYRKKIYNKKTSFLEALKNTLIFLGFAIGLELFMKYYLLKINMNTTIREYMIMTTVYLFIMALIVYIISYRRIEKNRMINIALHETMKEISVAYDKQAICQLNLETKDYITDNFIQNINLGVVKWSGKGKITDVNPFFLNISKYKKEELIGVDILELLIDRDNPIESRQIIEDILRGNEQRKHQLKIRGKEGNIIEFSTYSMPLKDGVNNISEVFTFAVDVTEQKRMERTLNYLAYYDDLTGLPNKHNFIKELGKELNKYGDKKKYGLFYIKVDDYNVLNRALTHNEIEFILKEVATRIGKEIDELDYLARIGDDEFAILINDNTCEKDLSNKACNIIEEALKPIFLNEEKFFINLKIGATIYDGIVSVDEFIKESRLALHHIKNSLESRYSFFNKEIGDSIIGKNYIVSELDKAIENREFTPYFQPISDIQDNKIIALETLIRWIHPEKGFIPPSEFIPISEETGQIYKITSIIIEKAIQQKQIWNEMGLSDIKITLNISSKSLNKGSLKEEICNLLKKYNVTPEEIILEITETAALNDEYVEDAILEFYNISKEGIDIALDDFGTGNSSLARLSKLPIKYLKLDAGFVRNIVFDEDEQEIVKSIIELANKLNLIVIAEGIENVFQLNKLKDLGCKAVQGFYIARPAPAEEIEKIF